LDVPATVEFNADGKNTDAGSFYDRSSRFIFGTVAYPFDNLKEAAEIKEEGNICDSNSKEPCAHMIPEIWAGSEGLLKAEVGKGCASVYAIPIYLLRSSPLQLIVVPFHDSNQKR
jgi:hypothetical protein